VQSREAAPPDHHWSEPGRIVSGIRTATASPRGGGGSPPREPDAADAAAAGAQARDAALALAGILIGIVGALAASRILASLLYGIGATDSITFASVSLVLGAVALAASYVPARRATRIDPTAALRCE
jgi:uncharacterized membrane protein YeaQ/YmgE (transglycosylase-associated protein family)